MPKLLVTVTDPQNAWLREEVARQALPGGVSELVRRIIDNARDQRLREEKREKAD
jgi:hypothetical protein